MKAIIMAGGQGSRLRPLTCKRPKPLVPVANRPVMEYCIDLLRDLDIKNIGVTLQYLPGMIEEYFGDGSDFGVNLNYFIEDKPLGTAGSVKNAGSFLDETFIVVSGDALTDFDLRPAIRWHKEHGALATLVLTTVDNPLEYGVVITNQDKSIRSFLEKPSWGEVFSDQVNTGIYILEPEVLDLVPEGEQFDFSKELFPRLLEDRKPLYGVTVSGYWCDIGNLTQYRQAQEDILSGKVKVKIHGENNNGIIMGEGVEVDPTAQIKGPALLGDFCRIGPRAVVGPYSILGPFTRVEEGASIKRSITWDNVSVGAESSLRGAVVCSRSSLKKRVQAFEGAVIGDGSQIDAKAEIRSDVKIWPEKCLGQDTVVAESVIWGRGTVRPLFVGSQSPGYIDGDLTPTQVTRLGSAFGATLKPGDMVGISTFPGGVGEILHKAIAVGLIAAGIRVAYLGELLTPVHRFAVRSLELAGGCHIKQDPVNPKKVWLHFVNDQGRDLTPGAVRKIENLYWREDGRQIRELYPSINFGALTDAYRDWLLSTLTNDALQKWKLKVALGGQGNVSNLIGQVLQQAGVDVIRLDFDPEKNWSSIKKDLTFFATEIKRYDADLGVAVDLNAEDLILFTRDGNRLTTGQQAALLARVYLELNNKANNLVAPVMASRAIDIVVNRMGKEVKRVKNHPGIYQEAMDNKQLFLQSDSIAALLQILQWLATQEKHLNQVLPELPNIYTATRVVCCPWEAKGRVMRTLINEESSQQIELLDGVQVANDKGWTLVLPDGETPNYHIYSEAFSEEIAEELASFYEERLKQLVNGEKV